jgi:hypothetical protein
MTNKRERYLARQRRYNASEKGHARWLAYYNRRMDDPDPVRRALFRSSELLRKRRYNALKRKEERAKRLEN